MEANYIALLPKLAGGTRPVGWFQSILRVWVRSRASLHKTWELNNAFQYGFAAQKHNTAVDVVWRQAFLAETAKNDSQFYVALLWDLHKCFDMVDHKIPVAAAIRHNYPLGLLRMCLAAYSAPRRILFQGIVSRQI